MKGYTKLEEEVDYEILECVVLVKCNCGTEFYLDYFQPVQCATCDKVYDITLNTNSYLEE